MERERNQYQGEEMVCGGKREKNTLRRRR